MSRITTRFASSTATAGFHDHARSADSSTAGPSTRSAGSGDRDPTISLDAQRLARGDEHDDAECSGHELVGQLRRGIDHVFAVVEHEQEPGADQVGDGGRTVGRMEGSVDDPVEVVRVVADAGEVDEAGAGREPLGGGSRDRERDTGLARPTRPRQRDEPGLAHRVVDLAVGRLESAGRPRCGHETVVQRGERGVEELRDGDVPGVVGGEVVAELPDAVADDRVGNQFDAEVGQVGVGQRCDVVGDLPGTGGAAQDVGNLDVQQVRSGEVRGEQGFRPPTSCAVVDERSDDHGRVDDDRHRRPASRCRRILAVDKVVDVCRLRSTIRCASAPGSGRRARSISSIRRYSWSERPERAARDASSSRTWSGTSRTVIEAMHAI